MLTEYTWRCRMFRAHDIHFSQAEHAEIGLSFSLAPSILTGSETGGHKLLLPRTQWLFYSTARVSVNKILHFVKLSIPCITLKSCMFSHSVCRCSIILQTTNSVYLKKNRINWLFFSKGQTGFLL